jgi:transcriptional regulator with XRE-family HTH domain
MRPEANERNHLGPRLRELRTAAGFSQAELERRSGIPKSRLSRYENGHLLPSITGLQRLSAALGVPEASLLGHAGEPREVFLRTLEENGMEFQSAAEAHEAAEWMSKELHARRKSSSRRQDTTS